MDEARRTDRLVFVSIGYFSCYWCHVMRRESFARAEIAEKLNTEFIPVLVDRELEPALDDYLGTFVQATRGYSGWPLNVFLTPDGYPLFGAVYLPPDQFQVVLKKLLDAWQRDRAGLERAATGAARQLQAAIPPTSDERLERADARRLLEGFVRQANELADEMSGGFGDASKFPMAPQLKALLSMQKRVSDPDLAGFLELTLRQMAGRGLRDQMGGGFFRYTTDPGWSKPHFEKMLYDNALLAEVYLEAADILDKPEFNRIAYETLDFMLRDLWHGGAFISSLSAVDDHEVEGGYYLWDSATLGRILDDDERLAAEIAWGLSGVPPFEQGYLPLPEVAPAEVARRLSRPTQEVEALLESAKARILSERGNRVLPRDTKHLSGWNGLALNAMARAGGGQGGQRYLQSARQLRDTIVAGMWSEEGLLRAAADKGRRKTASLQDYAYVGTGLLSLARATGDRRDFELARRLLTEAWQRFYTDRGWRRTDSPVIPMAQTEPALPDGPTPSPSAVILAATLQVAEYFQDDRLRERAEASLIQANRELAETPFFYASHISLVASHLSRKEETPPRRSFESKEDG